MAEFEPHLMLTVGSHTDLWHRFKKPREDKHGRVFLTTKCGREIYDHYNVRGTYNPRIDRFCVRCFPFGINSDGSYKERPEPAADAEGAGDTPDGEQQAPEPGVPITSTPEPLLLEPADGGDGGSTREEGSGVLGAGHEGHVEELPERGEAGEDTPGGSPDPEGGQGVEVRPAVQGQRKQHAGSGRKPKTGTN